MLYLLIDSNQTSTRWIASYFMHLLLSIKNYSFVYMCE